MTRIMVLAADERIFNCVSRALGKGNFELRWASLDNDFIASLEEFKPRVVILEREMSMAKTFRRLRNIKAYDPLLDVIIIGQPESEDVVAEVINQGALDYLSLPLRLQALLESLRKLEEKISLRRETHQLEKELASKYVFEGMVSRNPAMLEIFSLIERLARHPITVLITGETGTGKELAARAIHKLSPRKSRPMVVVDCTALPESLFESEVFGYEKGAFTGADQARPGLLKEADGGTIFFDEISEMPLSGQAKLLRFLSEKTYRPLGSNRLVKVDVRVLCATNRDLRQEVEKGRFREDLFHRINVAEVSMPPLRKRKEDIPLLCLYFIDRYNQRFARQVLGVSNRAKKILAEYDWPGNVRELEKVIERGVSLTQKNFIDIDHLPENLLRVVEQEGGEDQPYPYTELTLAQIERKHLLEVLQACNFNKQRTALRLGITRPALYRKLKNTRSNYNEQLLPF
ncbi:MAG: sigma 54-interacting transcriptional regulator [Candidatus Aminicenantales bacterium]